MPTVALPIGGRRYDVPCKAGGEDHLRGLAQRIDAKIEEASVSAGKVDEVRGLLYAAILLADETGSTETTQAAPPPTADPVPVPNGVAVAIERLAERIETLARRLEETVENA